MTRILSSIKNQYIIMGKIYHHIKVLIRTQFKISVMCQTVAYTFMKLGNKSVCAHTQACLYMCAHEFVWGGDRVIYFLYIQDECILSKRFVFIQFGYWYSFYILHYLFNSVLYDSLQFLHSNLLLKKNCVTICMILSFFFYVILS